MGMTYVRAKVGRPDKRGRSIEERFLVDTCVVYTVLPEKIWRALKLKPQRTVEFTLADGTFITRGVSECRFTIGEQSATSPVVLGQADDSPLLGAVTLETIGLIATTQSQRISGRTNHMVDGLG